MGKLNIGVLVGLKQEPEEEIRKVADLGLQSCQVCSWTAALWTDQVGDALMAACSRHHVQVSTFWAGYSGPAIWNFIDGPGTIGLVPRSHRAVRVMELKQAATFAARCGIPSITTHVGFLPEDPNDPLYKGTVKALKSIVKHCAKCGVEFWFETGQETPVNLLRTIERIGMENVGINLDTANLILYGKSNPVDALDVFGRYVRDLHVKDGRYPTSGDALGVETPLGEGKVDFKAVIDKLKALGYEGPLTIERECSGERQIADIKKAIELLTPLR